MKVLIKKAHIICSSSPFHGQIKDILITDGIIEKISDDVSDQADEIISNDNLYVSVGWMDIFSHFTDPGFEHKETLETGAAAAASGGFTDVMIIPNTNPAISSKTQVEYILQRSAALAVNIYPIASITKNTEGKELAEMYDMHSSGAIAFSDGIQAVQSPGVLMKAMQYVRAIDGVIIQVPDDKSISANGVMNEDIVSTSLGLAGKPALAEELMISRDIELLKYTNSKLHITGISTRRGIELVDKARKEGLKVSASVTPHHCFFCDEDLEDYDSNLKVNPPLRTRSDMMAIRASLSDGTIDCIASQHIPQHWDDKTCEFEYAKDGMTGLETTFGIVNSFEVNIEELIEKLTAVPRQLFNIVMPQIKEGEAACLTLFDKDYQYIFDKNMIRSKSYNSPYIGKTLKGKVIGIINKNKIVINPT